MREIKFSLIADGSSDRTLLKIIKWSLDDLYPKISNEGTLADFRCLPKPPKNLKDKIHETSKYFPYDILFIHRDAEKIEIERIDIRINEIHKELQNQDFEKTICIIPIKMMETWLLIDSNAIKKAAGNRNYTGNINLPSLNKLEKEQQPKELLHDLLISASGLKGRNLKRFNVQKAVHLVVENIEDFRPLRELVAFNRFEADLKSKIDLLLSNRIL